MAVTTNQRWRWAIFYELGRPRSCWERRLPAGPEAVRLFPILVNVVGAALRGRPLRTTTETVPTITIDPGRLRRPSLATVSHEWTKPQAVAELPLMVPGP